MEKWQMWQDYKIFVKDAGLDVCYVTLCMAESFMKAGKGSAEFKQIGATVSISQRNTFAYTVQRPKQEPYTVAFVKSEYQKTFTTILFECYILERARHLKTSFCFRDFLELEHDAFNRIVRRLRRKGSVIAIPQRTNPRFYCLAERLRDYQQKTKNLV